VNTLLVCNDPQTGAEVHKEFSNISMQGLSMSAFSTAYKHEIIRSDLNKTEGDMLYMKYYYPLDDTGICDSFWTNSPESIIENYFRQFNSSFPYTNVEKGDFQGKECMKYTIEYEYIIMAQEAYNYVDEDGYVIGQEIEYSNAHCIYTFEYNFEYPPLSSFAANRTLLPDCQDYDTHDLDPAAYVAPTEKICPDPIFYTPTNSLPSAFSISMKMVEYCSGTSNVCNRVNITFTKRDNYYKSFYHRDGEDGEFGNELLVRPDLRTESQGSFKTFGGDWSSNKDTDCVNSVVTEKNLIELFAEDFELFGKKVHFEKKEQGTFLEKECDVYSKTTLKYYVDENNLIIGVERMTDPESVISTEVIEYDFSEPSLELFVLDDLYNKKCSDGAYIVPGTKTDSSSSSSESTTGGSSNNHAQVSMASTTKIATSIVFLFSVVVALL